MQAMYKHEMEKDATGLAAKVLAPAAVLDAAPSSPGRDQLFARVTGKGGNALPPKPTAAPTAAVSSAPQQIHPPVIVAGVPLTGHSAALAAAALAASMPHLSPPPMIAAATVVPEAPSPAPVLPPATEPLASPATASAPKPSAVAPDAEPSMAGTHQAAPTGSFEAPQPLNNRTISSPNHVVMKHAAVSPTGSRSHVLQAAMQELARMSVAGARAASNSGAAEAEPDAGSGVPGLTAMQHEAEAALCEAAAAAHATLERVVACSSLLEAMQALSSAAAVGGGSGLKDGALMGCDARRGTQSDVLACMEQAGSAFARVQELRPAWSTLIQPGGSAASTNNHSSVAEGTGTHGCHAGSLSTTSAPHADAGRVHVDGEQGAAEQGAESQQGAALSAVKQQPKRWRRMMCNPMYEGEPEDGGPAGASDCTSCALPTLLHIMSVPNANANAAAAGKGATGLRLSGTYRVRRMSAPASEQSSGLAGGGMRQVVGQVQGPLSRVAHLARAFDDLAGATYCG